MKPLVFILLAAISAVSAQAQTLAEAARIERARRAQVARSRVFTSEDLRGLSTPLSMTPATAAPPTASPSAAAPDDPEPARPAPAQVVATPKYNTDFEATRNKARELQDRETALQLQLNDWNNRFFAPVTDQNSQAEAQTRIAETQKQLEEVRRELTDTRVKLQEMEVLRQLEALRPN